MKTKLPRREPTRKAAIELPAPRSAWLLLGDEASFLPLRRDSRANGKSGCWTCSPHIQVGDTLFFYFMTPRKAIHFIGRAVSRPYKDSSIYVMSEAEIHRHQWWVDYGFVTEIEPIPFAVIQAAAGELLMLKGRSGKLLRSKTANVLLKGAAVSLNCVQKAHSLMPIKRPVEFPDPARVSLDVLKEVPCAAFRLEADVEQYFLEPLLRLCGLLQDSVEVKRRYPIGRKVADYVVMRNGAPVCVIEAKLRICLDKARRWAMSPDVRQAAAYAESLDVPYLLVDCEEIHCFHAGDKKPYLQLERQKLRQRELMQIRRHLLSES